MATGPVSFEVLLDAIEAVGAEVKALTQRVDMIAGRVDAGSDVARTAMRQVNHSIAARLDGLLEGTASDAGAAERKCLVRQLSDRDYFLETLAEARIRPLQLTQVFPGIETQPVQIGAIDPDTAHPNHVDMLYTCAIARHIEARRIFEFGTYLGRTTYHLALGPKVEEVFTLDLDPSAVHAQDLKLGTAVRTVLSRGLQGHFFRGTEAERRITQLHGDSRSFDYSPYAGGMDFIFIDGGHTYDLIANDTDRALVMLKRAGVIVWHDFAPKARDVGAFARAFSQTRSLFWIEDTSLLLFIDGVDAMSYDAPTPVYARRVIKPD